MGCSDSGKYQKGGAPLPAYGASVTFPVPEFYAISVSARPSYESIIHFPAFYNSEGGRDYIGNPSGESGSAPQAIRDIRKVQI